MKWGISLKQLVVLQMFVGVFIPWGQMETFTAGGLLLALVIAIVKLVVGVSGYRAVRKQHGPSAS